MCRRAFTDIEDAEPKRFETSSRQATVKRRLEILTCVLGLVVCYVIHDALQERAFRQPGFTYGWAMTALEIFTMAFCATLGLKKRVEFLWNRDLMALALIIAISQGTGSAALSYVKYPLKVAAKSSKLVPTLMFSTFLTGSRYSLIDYAAAVLLCVGLTALGLADMQVDNKKTNLVGFVLLAIATCSDAIIPNLQDKLLRRLAIPSSKMVVLSNLGSFLFVLLFILVTGELVSFLHYVHETPSMILWLLAQCLSAYCGLRCYLGVIKNLGGVAGVLATSGRKVITLVLSFLLFRKPFTSQHAIAFSLLFLGVAMNLAVKLLRPKYTRRIPPRNEESPNVS